MSTDQNEAVPAPGLSSYKAAVDTTAQHIAAAFISSSSREVHAFARDLAHALQADGIDLVDAVGAHMKDIALRPDDMPF